MGNMCTAHTRRDFSRWLVGRRILNVIADGGRDKKVYEKEARVCTCMSLQLFRKRA